MSKKINFFSEAPSAAPNVLILLIFWVYYCAKRYVRREWLNPNVPLVSPSVRKIIDFCRKDMRVVRMLGSFDETQQRFLATSIVNPYLTRLATEKRTLRDPILDPVLVTFFSKVNKNVTGPDYRVSGLRMSTK